MTTGIRWRIAAMAAVLAATAAFPAPTTPQHASGSAGPAEQAAPDRPNIVVIVTDDMRADELRYLPKTRRLLGAQGTTYTNAISPHPVCCPARAELVTGQYGQNNGVQDNAGDWGGYDALLDAENTLGGWLQDVGYRTAYHGKYLNFYPLEGVGDVEPGWTRWDAQLNGIYSYRYLARFVDGDTYRDRYISRVIGNRSLATIRRFAASDRPFLSVVNHIAPHGWSWAGRGSRAPIPERRYQRLRPGPPPILGRPSFLERDVSDLPADLQADPIPARRLVTLANKRIRALRSVDDEVARVVAELRRLGELDETYVVFTSDNGYQLGEHRQVGKNLPFDESFDVPLVVRGPGVARGAVERTPVSLVDLPATLLDWARADPGREQDGLSIEDVQQRARAGDPARDTLLVQVGDDVADDTPGWWYRGVTTKRYLYAAAAGDPDTGILFDRQVDPYALDNKFDDPAYAAIRAELAARTDALTACAGAEECNRVFGDLPTPG